MNISESKPISTFPIVIDDTFKMLTIDPRKSKILGSYTFRMAQFPGDIDIREEVTSCCSNNDVANKFYKGILKVIDDIELDNNSFFMELKAGLDERFLIDPTSPHFEIMINNLNHDGLLTDDFATNILLAYQLHDYDLVVDILRKFNTLRWSINEIKQGYKTLPGNKIKQFTDAITEFSPVNIEIIKFINGRFVEASVFYAIIKIDENGNKYVLNLPQESLDNFNDFFVRELNNSINKMLHSKSNFNPFKILKRMWSLAKFTNDLDKLKLLYPILSSNLSRLYQLKGDFATIIKYLSKYGTLNMKLIKNELSEMKDRISYVLELDNDFLIMFNNLIDNIITKVDIDAIIDDIFYIEDILKELINVPAYNFLTKNLLI
jgi:hypothetical protein